MKIVSTHTLLIAAVVAALPACSSDNDIPSPGSGAEKGSLTFSVAVNDDNGDAKSRAYEWVPENNIITHDNFNNLSPFFRLKMVRNDGGWKDLAPEWLVRFGDDWRTASVKVNASEHALANRNYKQEDFESKTEYWNTNTTDFYGVAGFANEFRSEGLPKIEWDGTHGQHVKDITVWNSDPYDILWTYRREERQPDQWGNRVNLTFNHAMARLNFRFQNTNKNLRIEVRDLYIGNVYRCASLSLSGASSLYLGSLDGKRDLPANHGNVNAENLGQMWYDYKFQAKQDLRSGFKAFTIEGITNDPINAESARGGLYTLLVIPQTVQRWNPANAEHVKLTSKDRSAEFAYQGYDQRNRTNGGPAYLVINCKITDIHTGAVVWESRNYDDENNDAHKENGAYNTDFERLSGIIVPLTNGSDTYTWLPSRGYTYDIVFGEGAGWTAEGNPTLVPIRITASVGAFGDQEVWVPAN